MEYIDTRDLSSLDASSIHRLNVASRLTDLPMNNDSNISPNALGMSVKMDLEKRRSTQTQAERQTMYAGHFNRTKLHGMSDEISEAANIMKKLNNSSSSLLFREALATRMRLRTMALRNFSKHNYSDALLEAHYSLLLAKKFHLQTRNTPLCGEMAMELLILSKCYSHIGHFNKGRDHLAEFKFLVENTLLGYTGGEQSLSADAKYAIIDCDKKLFLNIVYLLAEILTGYGMWEDAEVFFSKYLTLYTQIYGETDVGLSNALNSVCIYMLKSKQYLKALPLCIKSLNILKTHYGDYESDAPNMRVADAYNNLGIVYRLMENPVDALQQFFKAIDMKMRILDDRNHPAIQDIFLSIGCCLHVLGHFTTAAAIYREVYVTRSDNLGNNHSSTIAVKQLLKDLERDILIKSEANKAEEEQVEKKNKLDKESEVKQTTPLRTTPAPYVDVSRITALYSTKLENVKTKQAKIDICDEVLYPTDRLVDLSKKLSLEIQNLPVINVPLLSRGTLYMKDGLPAMSLNPEAEDMLRRWGFNPPNVDFYGEFDKSFTTEDGIALYIPIVDERKNLLMGYHDKPLYVPNPAVYHTAKQQSRIKSSLILKIGKFSTKQVEGESSQDSVKSRVVEFERMKSGAVVDKPKVIEEPIETVAMTELLKNRVKNPQNSKFLAKIGALQNINVKKISPQFNNAMLKKSTTAIKMAKQITKRVAFKELHPAPKHKAMMATRSDIDDNENVIDVDVIGQTNITDFNMEYFSANAFENIKHGKKHADYDSTLININSPFLSDNNDVNKLQMVADRQRFEIDLKERMNGLSNISERESDDNETVMSNQTPVSCSDTPMSSDFESFNDYALTNMVFTAPITGASMEVDGPLPQLKMTRLASKPVVEQKLPIIIRNQNDVLPVEVARRVKMIRTTVDTMLSNLTDEIGEESKNKDGNESANNKEVNVTENVASTDDNKAALMNSLTTKTPGAKLVPPPKITTKLPGLTKAPAPKVPMTSGQTDATSGPSTTGASDSATEKDGEGKQVHNKNMCVLLDSEGNELAYVPWTIDLVSLSLARSCLQEDFLNRYAFLAKVNKEFLRKKQFTFGVETDEERKKNELLLCRMLLAGQGLEELGFAKIATSIQAISKDLTGGLTFKVPNSVLENMKQQQQLLEKQQKELDEKKKKEDLSKKEVAAKKMPPPPGAKKAPPPPGGKKAPPPLKTKGPPGVPGKKGIPKGGKKAPVKAVESNVRRFFWDPIFGDDAKDTMFTKQIVAPKVESADIEESFAKAAPKQKEKAQESKPKFIQLLPDSKRSYNMNIGLSKFSKHTFNEIREAIVHLDPNILTTEATESLLLLLPNNEELSIVSEFVKSGGDLSAVDKPEQFVASMVGIPIMKQRLECHQTALTFKDNYNEIYGPLETILDSCEAVMSSIKLNILSNFILSVGNTLNEGDPKKGNAEGFKPTTYPKLNDFRTTTKPSKTLLQYICDMVGDEDETVLDLLNDLRSLDAASKVDVVALDEKMNRFKNDLTKIKNAINLAQNAKSDYKDHFPSIMNEFLRDAEPKVNSLAKHYQDVMATFKETVRFSGYTEKEVDKIRPNELFKYIWSFAQSVEQCRKQREDARKKMEKKALSQSKAEEKKQAKQQPKNTKLTSVPKLLNNDMVNIVKSL
ncbi:uncharacterized protein TOT_040000368 [Theileria orientalis strain Shintoku]|uniref:FH2 domain-containing protein n=1 Tax=Theileria orientalis strain Shintoku TaxID=869250 RepID=J4DQ80_THEOR|nr:uncharacterized protein TOT_040000368 [Theileria orientalis strain Shintoku]BAM41989.1 uncharacterized protein TOT_040000368 [Theileria orientalis strain Shintoku]|eukprot:XP_009692290.1 uncharacterized protein TOT_040000368 [Theileria orientalis strain Shintoku]